MVGAQYTERIGILVHESNEAIGQLLNRFAIFDRPLDDLVVDIGDVANISHIKPGRLEPAVHHVKDDHYAGMTQMAVVVDRHAANIHANFIGLDWRKKLLFTLQGIMDF